MAKKKKIIKLQNKKLTSTDIFIAIITPLQDYELIYNLNRLLKLSFSKCTKANKFSTYKWESSEGIWLMISNKYIVSQSEQGLFSKIDTICYLEKDSSFVNFWLKIPQMHYNENPNIIKTIQTITQTKAVITNIETLQNLLNLSLEYAQY